MSKIEVLYSKYAHLDTCKFDFEVTEKLREELKGFKVGDLFGLEDHKQYLELLNRFRNVVKKFTDLNGDNFRKTIQDLLSVGASGIYSSELRFLEELIQNVDDCEYDDPTNAKLNIHCDDKITFEYNEKGFTPFNVFAITGIAEQAKNIDPNKVEIGEKGLGFKTVFGVAKTVIIQSGCFSFKLNEDDFTCPIPNYDNYEPVEGTRLILIMEPKKAYDIFQAFMAKYKSKDALLCKNPLLFLNKLSELRVYFDNYRSIKFTAERRFNLNTLSECEKPEHIKLTYEDGKEIHDEITCIHFIKPIIFDEEACVSRYGKDTAFKSKKMNMQVIVPDIEYVKAGDGIKKGSFYSFLPTKVEIPVPIVCHIPFKLDPSREHIDSQKSNKWFTYSCNKFSLMFEEVLIDLAKTYKEDIVYYLPRKYEFLFNSEKEYADLELPYFKGEHFLALPLFYTATGGFLPADQVYDFSEPEKLQAIDWIAEIIGVKKHLFHMPVKAKARSLNIEIFETVTDRLFNIAFVKPEYAEEIFKILSNYDGFSFDEKIEGKKLELNIRHIKAIFTSAKCKSAFKEVALYCLKSGSRPAFSFIYDEQPLDVRCVDNTLNIETDDFGDVSKKYLSWIKFFCFVSDDVPAGEYFVAQNILILSNHDRLKALSSFCRDLDPNHIFASTLDFRRCSKELDEVDDSLSATDYLKKLRSVRKTIRNAFGNEIYTNYINIINQSGTDSERYIKELLQNADDCDYPIDVTPSFELEVSKDLKEIQTTYNEKGFTKANVRAITAIGESTKKKLINKAQGVANFIGEKGVGFKSVFAIAYTVKIYSGNFNFELSANEPTIPALINKKDGCESGTTMLFELKEKMSLDFFTEEKVINLCLCLRKLKHIKLGEYKVKIEDDDSKRKIIINDNNTYEYMKVAYKFIVDDQLALSERRKNKKDIDEKQTIIFYIPLNNKFVNKPYYLCSGLPTEIETKIPLVIDAPFELDTARTNVIDNKWNSFILDKFYEALKGILLSLCKSEGMDVLRFVKIKKENSDYLIDIFSNMKLNKSEFLDVLKSIDILPNWKTNGFVSAKKPTLWRVPRVISYILEKESTLGMDTSCFLKCKDDEYVDVLTALGIKMLPFDTTMQLLNMCYLNYITDGVFLKMFYKYLEEHKMSINLVRNMLKLMKIIPVKGKITGETEFLCWNECGSNLYVKDLVVISPDTCWILDTRIFEKSLCEYVFESYINELTRDEEENKYRNKLLDKLEDVTAESELYEYLISEYHNNYHLISKCQDALFARKNLIPLKNQLGKFKKGNIYVSKTDPGYFSGEFMPSHIVHKECESFADFIRCTNIEDVFHDDLDINAQLSADDIEDLKDDYIINGYEILAFCVKIKAISSELILKYGLEKLSDITVEYDEDIFNQPIDDIERFYKRLQERIANPIKIDFKKVVQTVRVGITNKGEEVSLYSDDRRYYNTRKYALKTGHCVCQMCKKAKLIKYIEVNNIEKLPKYHWEECGVVLCLECSKHFEELREDEEVLKRFHKDIKQAEVNCNMPIEIPIANQTITFSQRHLAEIQEILKRQDSIL